MIPYIIQMREPNINSVFPNIKEFNGQFRSIPVGANSKVVHNNTGFVLSEGNNPIFRGKYITKASIPVNQSDLNGVFLDTEPGEITYSNDLYDNMGNYIGRTSTQTKTGENISGEWIQITLPYKALVDKCICTKRDRYEYNPSAEKIAILGSNDAVEWTLLESKKHEVYSNFYYFSIDSTSEFNTYRCVITRGFIKDNNDNSWSNFFRRGRGNGGNSRGNGAKISKIALFGSYPKVNLAGQTITTDGFSNIEGLGMMANETQLLNDLNVFNTAYGSYVEHCKGLTSKRWTDPSCNDLSGNVMTAYNKIATFNGSNVLTGGSLFEVQNSYVTNYVSREVADASFNIIKTKHKDIMKMRSELDVKLKELNAADGSFTQEQKRILDGTVYTSVIWTVLATTTLYYVFKNI
jgi:hypothetical protein